jgi:hypothetical protein
MKTHALVLATLFSYVASTAVAQHADIRPYVQNDQIVMAGFEDATSTELPGLRVFGYDFGEDPAQPFFAQDPGFNASAGSGLPPGSQLLFNIVGAGSMGLPANLSYWDGLGDVEFGLTPSDETLTLSIGSQSRVADDSTSGVAGFSIQTVTASGSVHRHLSSILNEGTGNPTAGIFLLPLELASSDLTVEKSLPFFVVYNNGLSEGTHDQAIDWVQQSLVVPEASPLVLASIACATAALVRRRPDRPQIPPRSTTSLIQRFRTGATPGRSCWKVDR